MEVILLEKVNNLGNLGEQVSVRPGYGRNYLIPQGKAVPATATNVAAFEARRAELEKTQQALLADAKARAEKIEATTLIIPRKVGMEGKLFGSVTALDIVEAAKSIQLDLRKQDIRLPNGPIRLTGDYQVELGLHADVVTHIKVQVVAED
jgi:large subunit ribosomal protein L9